METATLDLATQTLKYDYDQIAPGHRERVIRAAQVIHEAGAAVRDNIVRIGLELIEVKKRIDHGQFEAWCNAEFGLKERMAQNWMNVAREYSDPAKAQTFALFSPSVLYLLAAPSTPDEARTEIEEAAAEGRKITVELTQATIQAHKPRAEIKPIRDAHKPLPEPPPAKVTYLEKTYPRTLDTPADLAERGLFIEEYEPHYFRWRGFSGPAEGHTGAGCDSAEDAIRHARTVFSIVEGYPAAMVRAAIAEITAEPEDPSDEELAAMADVAVPAIGAGQAEELAGEDREREEREAARGQATAADEIKVSYVEWTHDAELSSANIILQNTNLGWRYAWQHGTAKESDYEYGPVRRGKKQAVQDARKAFDAAYPPQSTNIEAQPAIDEDASTAPDPLPMIAPEWVDHVLTHYDPINADFQTALGMATTEQLEHALFQIPPSTTPALKKRRQAVMDRLSAIVLSDEERQAVKGTWQPLADGKYYFRGAYLKVEGNKLFIFWVNPHPATIELGELPDNWRLCELVPAPELSPAPKEG